MNKDQNSLIKGALYVVALPIGNALDMNTRAIEVLRHADIVAAEDTRTFQNLSQELTVQVQRLVAYHDHNEKGSSQGLIDELRIGKTVALVSDAGTPNISDPGYHLLQQCYLKKIPVYGIPGASAVTLALSICPVGGSTFFFGGFPPVSSGDRKKLFAKKSHVADRILFFESPHRVIEHLEDAQEFFKGKAFILREGTKKYEETLYADVSDLLLHFQKNTPKGEFVIVYPGQPEKTMNFESLKKEIQDLISENLKPTDIWKRLQDLTDLTRREIYDLITEIKHKKDNGDD